MDAITFPETFPAVAALKVDAEDNLWAEEYVAPGDTASRWRVFTPEGVWLGSVAMPTRFRLLRVYSDAVLGVWQDSVDVEHVRLHGLTKPSG